MELARKVTELSDRKVINYLDGLVQRGKVHEVLALFPQITDSRPAVRDLLEAIREEAVKRAERLEQPSAHELEVKQLDCGNCGAHLHQYNAGSQRIVCQYCGSSLEPQTGAATGAQFDRKRRFAPLSFIRLGHTARFDNVLYQVVGRLCYVGKSREWDYEDNRWWSTAWRYDEWLLMGEDGSYRYLVEDKEGFSLARTYVPKAPQVPAADARSFSLSPSHGDTPVKEHGDYRLKYCEGEFSWRVESDEQLVTAAYARSRSTYSVESRFAAGADSPEAIEFYVSKSVSKRTLLMAFGEKEALAELEQERQRKAVCRNYALVFAVVALVMAAIGMTGGKGNVVETYQVTLSEAGQSGQVVGPFELDAVGRTHQLRLRGSMPDNSWSWVGIELLNDQQDSINVIEGNFWRESGRDSDGSWSESDLRTAKSFRLTEPGQYYLRVVGEGSGSVDINIHEKALLKRYFWFAALLAAGMAYSLYVKQRVNPLFALGGLLMLVVVILAYVAANADD